MLKPGERFILSTDVAEYSACHREPVYPVEVLGRDARPDYISLNGLSLFWMRLFVGTAGQVWECVSIRHRIQGEIVDGNTYRRIT